MRTMSTLAGLAVAATLFAAPAFAETQSFAADLKGASEAPPNTSKGTGDVKASVDTTTKKLNYTITFSGLTGPATAAHFHGPAMAGANAPPLVPIKGALTSPIKGEATLTDAQMKDFADGKVYLNIHTAAHKDGEIRGQMMKH